MMTYQTNEQWQDVKRRALNRRLRLQRHSVPVVECSRDNGVTWSMWNYWRSTQEDKAAESCRRLTALYPEFLFRLAWTFVVEEV